MIRLYYTDLGRLIISLAIVVAIVETTVGAIVVILATVAILATLATLATVLATLATLAKSARNGKNASNGTNGRSIVNGRNTSNGRNTVINIIIGRINISGRTDSTGSNSRKSAKGSTMSGISFGSSTCVSSVNFDNEVLSKLSSKIFLAKSSYASYFSPFKYRE